MVLKDHCGVIGLYDFEGNTVSDRVCEGLYSLQHRGQEACGVYSFNGRELVGLKGPGMVSQVFDSSSLTNIEGNAGIGHVMYPTTSIDMVESCQPFLFKSGKVQFTLAFNGTISNFLDAKNKLEAKGVQFKDGTDTEVLAQQIASRIKDGGTYFEAFEDCFEELDGAYSLVLVTGQGDLYGARDPVGFRPLCFGKIPEDTFVIASESVAIDTLGGELERDIDPGEVIKVSKDGVEKRRLLSLKRHALCMFEYVYFERPDSNIQGKNVYETRVKLGKNLARTHPADIDIVIPVPDSGRSAAFGYAEELGCPIGEGLIKNRYIGRTFIQPGQRTREYSVKLKLNPVKQVVKGKRIALIDDSIVRGTTMRRTVRLLKATGVREVHVRPSCPPLISPCYMGIDFPTKEELIASNRTAEEIADFIEADSLGYQTIEGLVSGIGLRKCELCLACLTGEYPLRKKVNLELMEATLGGRR
jgi:amidophosphoribosyltransferase